MTTYRVNPAAVEQARSLIDAGTYDDQTPWSRAARNDHPEIEEAADELLSRLDGQRG